MKVSKGQSQPKIVAATFFVLYMVLRSPFLCHVLIVTHMVLFVCPQFLVRNHGRIGPWELTTLAHVSAAMPSLWRGWCKSPRESSMCLSMFRQCVENMRVLLKECYEYVSHFECLNYFLAVGFRICVICPASSIFVFSRRMVSFPSIRSRICFTVTRL